MEFKRTSSSCMKWASNLKVRFYWRCCNKFRFTPAFICVQSSFLFQYRKKALKTYIVSTTCFCNYREYLNKHSKNCPLPSCACFQQHFHVRLPVLRYNLDLAKLEWTLVLFNFKDANCSPITEYASFSH